MVWWLSLSLIMQNLTQIIHLNMTLIAVQRTCNWRRNVRMSAPTCKSARHHVIALNAIHGWQNTWKDSRITLEIRVRLRVIQASLILALIDRILFQELRGIMVRESDCI